MSRDVDSVLTAREQAAVKEWQLNSSEPLHVMRDLHLHVQPMMGGMWDLNMTRKSSRNLWSESWNKILNDPRSASIRSSRGPDQELLKESVVTIKTVAIMSIMINLLSRHVWNDWGCKLVLQHDSYSCTMYPYNSLGWPTKREQDQDHNFVGSIFLSHSRLEDICPIECRRNLEWETC